jgi:hypothetical protein
MEIKVFGKNKELFNTILERVLNIASVACMGGYIPSEYEKLNPEGSGLFWFKEENCFHLGRANDHWGHIRSQGEDFVVLEFTYRYDTAGNPFATALCNLIATRFPDEVDICEQI